MINHRISSTIPSIKYMMVNTAAAADDDDDDEDDYDDYNNCLMTSSSTWWGESSKISWFYVCVLFKTLLLTLKKWVG